MKLLAAIIAALTLSLWFGGLMMLFIAVQALFQTFERETAGQGGTAIFHRFERFQLALAAVAIVSCWFALNRGRAKLAAMGLLLLAAALAVVITFGISPRIDAMRLARETDTASFRRLHGIAMATYLLVTHLVGGAIIAAVVSSRVGTSSTMSTGRAFPAAPADSTRAS